LQSFCWLALLDTNPGIFDEHGPMENFQIACLFFAAIWWASFLRHNAEAGSRVLILTVILLHCNFFALEFDVRPFNVWWLTFLFKGIIRNSVLAISWLYVIILFCRCVRSARSVFLQWIATRSGKVMMLAGLLWVLGFIVDKSKPFALEDHSYMAEELLETNATFLMVVSAISFRRSGGNSQPN
ncbi:MAG: hypothetical protein ACXW3Z_15005, partial [Limisphaerales bacterium]